MKKGIRTLPYSVIGGSKVPRTDNAQHLSLWKFFKKIKENSENPSHLLCRIEKKLRSPLSARQPVKIGKLLENADVKAGNKTAIVIAKVLDDDEFIQIPKINVVALKWSKGAQEKIEATGGSIKPLDQFLNVAKSMDNLTLVYTNANQRKSARFWGKAPGAEGSTALPRTSSHKHHNREKPVRKYKKYNLAVKDDE